MTDIDSRILALVGDVTYGAALQELVDEMVIDETGAWEKEVRIKDDVIARLTDELGASRSANEMMQRAHVKQTAFAQQNAEYILSVTESKNIFVRLAGKLARWPNAVNEYDRLKYETATETLAEQHRQDVKWGPARQQPNGTGSVDGVGFSSELADYFKSITDEKARKRTVTWADILLEEVYEALAETNPRKLRTELIQVAAVCLSWIVSLKLQRPKG